MLDKQITGVVVTWNTKDLFIRAYESIRSFHPNMKIIVVDGSSYEDPCYKFIASINDNYVEAFQVGHNIGHGRGMNFGIKKVSTPYVLFFDSDIKMIKSPLKDMAAMIESNTYGVGYLEKVGLDGFDYGVHLIHRRQKPVKYLHPYFQLVQVKEYYKHRPYIHHGAPCIAAMLDLHRKNLSDKALKEFPGLGHTTGQGLSWKACNGEYILHDVAYFGGTGRMRLNMGLPHIEGKWDKAL